MKKKRDKDLLFERMEKVDPTFKRRINEDMYTDDQITQNFDSWHEPEYDPESKINEPEMSTEELISSSEQFIKDMEAQLNRTNPNNPNRKFFEEMITSTRETIENMKKQQGLKEEDGEGNTNLNKLYQTKILPNLNKIAADIKQSIDSGEIEVKEKLSNEQDQFKYGAYHVGESWHILGEILINFSETLDNHRTIIDSGFGDVEESVRDDYVNKLLNDLENKKLIYLEW